MSLAENLEYACLLHADVTVDDTMTGDPDFNKDSRLTPLTTAVTFETHRLTLRLVHNYDKYNVRQSGGPSIDPD